MISSKWIRRIGLLNLIAILLAVLAGCAAPAAPAATDGEAAADGEVVTIRFVTNHGEVELPFFQQVVDEFEAANPNIKIDFLNVADTQQFQDSIKTQGVGGSLPDVWYARTYLTSDYASKGWTMNLQPLVEQDELDVEDFWPAQVAQMSYEGDLYALPYDFSDIGIYYNKDMFDAAGIPYPSDDWTWDDLAEVAEQFVVKDGDTVTQWGLVLYPWSWVWLGILQANGGAIFNEDQSACVIDSPENLATLEFFQEMRSKGIYPELGATPAGLDPFSNGLVAMAFQGSWATQSIRDRVGDAFEFDVVAMPAGTTGRRGITPAGGAWAIASTSEHPDEAWDFIKFLTSTESTNTLISDNTRSIPGRQSSTERWVEVATSGDLPPANVGIFAEMMGDAYEIVYPPYWSDYEIAWNNLIQPAIVGGEGVLGPAEALAAMQEQCNDAIAAMR